MTKPTLVVIFGAGASFDFSWRRPVNKYPLPDRIPLAKDLFHEMFGNQVRDNRASRGLMRRMRAAAAKSPPEIEPELEQIKAEAANLPYLRRQLRGVQHYLRDVIAVTQAGAERVLPDGVTNYVELIHEIERWRALHSGRVCLVTFNYDTLLESACESVLNDFRLNQIEAYIADQRYAIIKLHGSIDWGEVISTPGKTYATGGYDDPDRSWNLKRSGDIRMYASSSFQETVIPAIALPTVTKTSGDFVCPATHVEALSREIAAATHLLVIGWRGAEGHFHELWRKARGDNALARWAIVDYSNQAAAQYGLQEARDRIGVALKVHGKQMFWSEGFSEFTQNFAIREFLES